MSGHVRTGSPALPACGCLISLALISLGVAGLTGALPALPSSSAPPPVAARRPPEPPAPAEPAREHVAGATPRAPEEAPRKRAVRERVERERAARERAARAAEGREPAPEPARHHPPAARAERAPSPPPVSHPSWRRTGAMALGNWRAEGPLYLGVIVALSREGATLVYLDGTEEQLPFDRLAPDVVRTGATVEFPEGDGWVRARLERRRGIAARVRPETHGRGSLWVSLATLRLPADTALPTAGAWSSADLHAITFVRYADTSFWYAATVVEEDGDLLEVVFCDGERQTRSRVDVGGSAYLQSRRLEVELRRGDAWVRGTVARQHGPVLSVRTADAPPTWTSLAQLRLFTRPR